MIIDQFKKPDKAFFAPYNNKYAKPEFADCRRVAGGNMGRKVVRVPATLNNFKEGKRKRSMIWGPSWGHASGVTVSVSM